MTEIQLKTPSQDALAVRESSSRSSIAAHHILSAIAADTCMLTHDIGPDQTYHQPSVYDEKQARRHIKLFPLNYKQNVPII